MFNRLKKWLNKDQSFWQIVLTASISAVITTLIVVFLFLR